MIKHRFDATWAQDLYFVYRDAPRDLSIAAWRYCCWAATRHGVSVAQQQRTPEAALIREAIYTELKRRADRVGSVWNNCALPPYDDIPGNALGRVFVGDLARMGKAFWAVPPSRDNLV